MLKACRELSQGLEKLVRVTEDPYSEEEFTADEHIRLYTIVYDLCTVKGNCRDMEEVMYNSFAETVEEYLSDRVLPPLQRMQGDELAQQFVTKWVVYKDVYEKVSHIFYYLLRSFMDRKILDPAKLRTELFYDRVFKEIHQQVAGAAIAMINRFREGEEINAILLRQIFAVMVQIGDGTLKYYNQYFEGGFLEHTQLHYYRKAMDWGYVNTKDRYIIKIAESLTTEEHIGSLFLYKSTGPKLKQKLHNAFRAATLNVMDQLVRNELQGGSGSEEDD